MKLHRVFAVLVLLLLAVQLGAAQQKPGRAPAAVLRDYVAAWNHHDVAALDALLTEDSLHEDISWGVRARGPAAIHAFMRDVISSMPDFEWRLTNVVASGSTVAAEWTWTATFTGQGPYGSVKGLRISGRGVSVVEVQDARLKRLTDYYDNASFFPKPAAPTR